MVQTVLRQGRSLRPDFHVTYDFVHPNEAGHLGIAVAMLRRLGEEQAAQRLVDERLAALMRKLPEMGQACRMNGRRLTKISRRIVKHTGCIIGGLRSRDSRRRMLGDDYWLRVGRLSPPVSTGTEVAIAVSDTPWRRENFWTLEAEDQGIAVSHKVKIRPPWLVATGLVQPLWTNLKFDPAKADTPFDELIRRGDLAAAIAKHLWPATPLDAISSQRQLHGTRRTGQCRFRSVVCMRRISKQVTPSAGFIRRKNGRCP